MTPVHGIPGGSLLAPDAVTWARSRRVADLGAAGEQRTAAALADAIARRPDAHLFHDLTIPAAGGRRVRANLDHLLLAGGRILLLESKVWRPGVLWTVGGTTRRGLQRVAHADRRTLGMARDLLGRHLAAQGLHPAFDRPMVVVWPSSEVGRLHLAAYRPADGARAIHGGRFARRAHRLVHRGRSPDALVAALHRLVREQAGAA